MFYNFPNHLRTYKLLLSGSSAAFNDTGSFARIHTSKKKAPLEISQIFLNMWTFFLYLAEKEKKNLTMG